VLVPSPFHSSYLFPYKTGKKAYGTAAPEEAHVLVVEKAGKQGLREKAVQLDGRKEL
jgi:hypothetical protein